MKDILMPSFGADMAKGELAQWQVKPGDKVSNGDIIASIETMKGLIDMEVFDDGVIENLVVSEGQEVKVGQVIAQMRLATEPVLEPEQTPQPSNTSSQPAPVVEAEQTPQPSNTESQPASATNEKPKPEYIGAAATYAIKHRSDEFVQPALKLRDGKKISPLALKTAQQQGIDWQQLEEGSGPDGAIVMSDITALIATQTPDSAPAANKSDAPQKLSSEKHEHSDDMRKAISAVVSQSKREIPHYYLQLEVVLDKAQQWLTDYNKALPTAQRIHVNALIYMAVARALEQFPAFNGFYQNDKFTPAKSVHLGNAISLRQGGLVVAAIHNAQHLNCNDMMFAIKDQVMRAREGGLRMSEMQDSTVTISNLGERGVDSIQSIIFPPQVAILGVGRLRFVPWIVENRVDIASIVSISLAADHRVSDGHSGARLLNKINKLLQTPELLV